MSNYRRDRRSQNPATANVGALDPHQTMPATSVTAVTGWDDDEDGVDLGDIDAPQNRPCPNVDVPATQGTTPCNWGAYATPYHQESISRNF